ncbi:MAG: CocE/NonD family hydrolase [Candidatus Aminicenantes bacterium]|nr:MAG: CocE/NonD family hydrolase [Candidatus Aminicenantes bacterium]
MKKIKFLIVTLLLTFSVNLLFFCSRETTPPPEPEIQIPEIPFDPAPFYSKREALISMRDGIGLHTEIYVPRNSTESLPFLMMRTPYGLPQSRYGYYWRIGESKWWFEFVREGYIFVVQDIRGRYKSGGEFIMMRPPNPGGIDEGTDTYDTIDWLLQNVSGNNGRVGIFGVSYDGWLAVMAMINPHPAIKAVSPQGSPSDMFIGDDFFHNGAFRLSPGFGYAALMELSDDCTPFNFDKDVYEWYLELGPLSNVNKNYFQGNSPTWNNFMTHPNYDEYWQKLEVTHNFNNVNIPTLNVAGWWDAEDFYGSMKIYEVLEMNDLQNLNYLIVGPWSHGGWKGDGQKLYDIDFGCTPSLYYRENIQAPWFAYFLKDKGNLNLPEALAFQTGKNEWKSYNNWPPKGNIEERQLYFHKNGRLSFELPQGDSTQEFDSYVSNPANPIPYTEQPINGFWQGSKMYWKVEDQRFIQGRSDVLSWQTDVLEEEVIISGRIIAKLFASTSGTDCDWVVKLIDVYPENHPEEKMRGYQLMIADEVFRAKFRNSFEIPEPLIPNKITKFTINLNSRNHCFLKGHRIMVQVQSTWFPLIGRNPQKFVNIPTATEADYQVANQHVFRSGSHPSHVVLPISKF